MSHINCDRCFYKWNNNDRHGGSIPNNHLVRDMFKVTFNYKIDKISVRMYLTTCLVLLR